MSTLIDQMRSTARKSVYMYFEPLFVIGRGIRKVLQKLRSQ